MTPFFLRRRYLGYGAVMLIWATLTALGYRYMHSEEVIVFFQEASVQPACLKTVQNEGRTVCITEVLPSATARVRPENRPAEAVHRPKNPEQELAPELTEVVGEDVVSEGPVDSINQALITLTQALQSMESLEEFELINDIKQHLQTLAQADSDALAELMGSFRANLNNPRVRDELFSVLVEIRDPEVERMAMDFARSAARNERVLGLDLLGKLNIPSQETLQLASQVIAQNPDDNEVILSAVSALPNISLPEEKNTEVLNLLGQLARKSDEAVRSASLFAIGQRAKDWSQMGPVVQALSSSQVDDRISGVMAIERSRVVSPELKNILLDRMQDSQELWEVRAMAANSLDRFNLAQTEFSLVENFRKQL